MARVNVETRALAESRLWRLAEDLNMSRAEALGMLVIFWHDTQERGIWKANRETLLKMIPFRTGQEKCLDLMIENDYVSLTPEGNEYLIRGNKKHIEALRLKSEAGKLGGTTSGESRRKKTKQIKPNEAFASTPEAPGEPNALQCNTIQFNSKQSSSIQNKTKKLNLSAKASLEPTGKTVATWEAYREAYKSRYGEAPIRNQTLNGILARFVARVPAEEAPRIAEFYLTHNNAFYLNAMHPVSLLLRDAEKLRTEWITGNKMLSTTAREIERKQSNSDVWHNAARILNEKRKTNAAV